MNIRSDDSDVTSTPTDVSLLQRFRKGEEDAATELYMRYARRLISIARRNTSEQLASRFDAEDVVQSVFRTFFRRAAEGSYDVPPGEEIWQLLLAIALNKVRRLGKFHRRQRRSVDRTSSADLGPLVDSADSETPMAMLQIVVDEALQQLPELQRTMIEMRIQGYAVPDIAVATGRGRRTIERVLRRFRAYMADYLEDEYAGDA